MLCRIAVDLAMTLVLLLLMTYERIGQGTHEWLGVGLFVLFILHHVLNRRWIQNIPKGRYTAERCLKTVLDSMILVSMLGSMVSGVILSQTVFSFLPIHGGRSFARYLHMLSAYWGYVLMGLHLGLHWRVFVRLAGRKLPQSRVRSWAVRAVGALIALYGVFAVVRRELPEYMLLKTHFVFFDYGEPLALFLLDYLAIMGLFVWVGHKLCPQNRI